MASSYAISLHRGATGSAPLTAIVRRAGLVVLAVAVALLAAGCGSRPPATDPATGEAAAPAEPGQPPDHCTTGDDCELVEACCGCGAGGRRFAIRKDAVASYMSAREQRCANIMCPQVMSRDPSCDAEAICGSRNRCRVAPHMQHQ